MEGLGVEGSIIVKWIFRSGMGRERIDLAEGRDRWLALVNAERNLRVP